MNKYELMNCLHQYTPWEMLHMHNMDYIQSIEGLNQSLEHSLTQEDKASGLHLPTEPALPYGTLSGLSEHFHYSPQHMSKLVRAITGSSLSQYVLQKRMEAARTCLPLRR